MDKPKEKVATKLDTYVDDLHNIKEDESAQYLMHLNSAINKLNEKGIYTISQIKLLYDQLGEKNAIKKLTEVDRIGKKMAEIIVTKAALYEYPKGYIPNAASLPGWITGESEEDNDEPIYPEEGTAPEPVTETKFAPITVDEIESIDINDYASNLIDESQLPATLLSIVFDLFDDENCCAERIQNDPGYKYDQQNLYYNSKIILVQKEYLMKVFNERCRNLKTINNLDLYNMFHVAVKRLNCVYHYLNKKDGHTWWWGRKPNLLGDNPNNYIEIYRAEAEQMLNREFNIPSAEEISQLVSDLGFNMIPGAVEPVDNSINKFYIIPDACSYENGKYIFKFNIAEIRDRLDFNMKDINWKSGTYVFSKANINNGELLLTRGFTDKDYDEILILVGEFLAK